MENFIYTIAAAALSGLAFLAYRHPEAHAKLSGLINVAFVASIAYLSGWNYAVITARIVANKYIPPEEGVEALAAFQNIEYSIFQSFALPLIFYVFHLFLLALPYLTATDKKPDA